MDRGDYQHLLREGCITVHCKFNRIQYSVSIGQDFFATPLSKHLAGFLAGAHCNVGQSEHDSSRNLFWKRIPDASRGETAFHMDNAAGVPLADKCAKY